MKFQIISKKSKEYNQITNLCMESYWNCKLLDRNSTFGTENPDFYSIVKKSGKILATLGTFIGNNRTMLPIDKVMRYEKDYSKLKIEIGRLSFFKNPSKKSEIKEICDITEFLIANYFYFSKKFFPNSNIYFETHQTIIKLLTKIFGKEFISSIPHTILWNQIPIEWADFFKKFANGEAALYKVDMNILEQVLRKKQFNSKLQKAVNY